MLGVKVAGKIMKIMKILKLVSYYFFSLANGFATSSLIPQPLRWLMLKPWAPGISRCSLGAGVKLMGRNVRIGRGAFINVGCVIGDGAVIGQNVSLGPYVIASTQHHDDAYPIKRAGSTRWQPVIIGAGSWIGGGRSSTRVSPSASSRSLVPVRWC